MINIIETDNYVKWFKKLSDNKAKYKISERIRRLIAGNPGDVKSASGGISELRIKHGPGYRIYYKKIKSTLIILLAGGDKSTQDTDIKKALILLKNL